MTAPFINMDAEEAAGFMSTKEDQRWRGVVALRCLHKTVADLGCGRGIGISQHYSPENYFGFDCSAELVAIARKSNPEFTFTTLDLRDKNNICLKYGQYDVALLCSVLEHQESLKDALKLYDVALNCAETVVVAWHTPPVYSETEIITVDACDLSRPLYQNHYERGSFDREDVQVEVERVDNFTLWTATRN